MPDLMTAAQDAIFAALEASATGNVAGVAKPVQGFEYVPQGEDPPYWELGDFTFEPAGGKDGGLDLLTFEIHTQVREPKKRAVQALMTAVREAIEGAALESEVAEISAPVFLSADAGRLADGETYEGTQRFSCFVQPAPYGPDLITNGGADTGANWTPSALGGGALPTIAGGVFNFTSTTEGNVQRFDQTLADGEQPAGDYLLTFDMNGAGNFAFNLNNGAGQSDGHVTTGTGQQFTLTALAPFTVVQLQAEDNCTVDNVKLQPIL